jgi:hypothetical protein
MTVVYVATPDPLRVGEASGVDPSENAIEPDGIARPGTPVTVNVKVTDCP